MNVRAPFRISVVLISTLLIAQQRPAGRTVIRLRKVVDLTHPLNASTPNYEETKEPAYRATTVATLEKEHYFAREICLPEHFGTHLDAPAHFANSWNRRGSNRSYSSPAGTCLRRWRPLADSAALPESLSS